MRVTSQRVLASLLVAVLLVSGGTGVALADGHATTSDVTKLGGQDITVSDVTITVSDTHLSGPGFPDVSIDHRTYTLDDSTMSIDGLHVSVNGHQYEICNIDVTLKNIGVTLDNVQISSN
ncbi:hypothetical protein [Haladaptatus sp. R4]|uniref:hypothetical protein n=1 Tax=Haladaptatus sp. R4 TaxID=1679489 RepID=UPI001CBAE23D|nr:hypothetical protein [Haladaptatus sp. R4]